MMNAYMLCSDNYFTAGDKCSSLYNPCIFLFPYFGLI